MKYFLPLLFLILSAAGTAHAQDANYMTFLPDSNTPSRTDYFWGLSYLRWNETLRLQKASLLDTDSANFTGLNFNLERQVIYAAWGWIAGLNLGSGKANGGGNSSLITYTRNNQSWTSFGANAKIFQRLTPRVFLGASIPFLMRTATWPTDAGGVEAASGQNFNLGLLMYFNLRIDRRTDLYQEIGTLNAQGSTLWRLGLNVRF